MSTSTHLRRDLRASLLDAAFFSLMVGLGESYLSAFVLAMDGGQIASGLVIAAPLLAGAVLQLASPWAVRRLGSHKRWVLICSTTQCLSLLLLPIAAWFGSAAVDLVYLAAVLYWGAGLATGPAWNTWIEGVVPRRVRTRFFACRVRTSQFCTLIGFVAGGFSLEYGKRHGYVLMAFAATFLAAAVCRFVSVSYLWIQSESRERVEERRVSVRETFRRGRGGAGARLLAYLFSVNAAAFLAGPYFVPFMLRHLEMTYENYAVLIGTSYVGKALTAPLWGRVAHYAGPRRLLWIGGLSIVPMSGAWMVSQNFWYLCGLQLFAGVTWAAFELAFFLLFFETIPREERTSVLTTYNLGYSASQVAGAALGAVFLGWFDKTYDAYLWLFVLSTVARAATIGLLARIPKVAPAVEHVPTIGTTAAATTTAWPAESRPATTPD